MYYIAYAMMTAVTCTKQCAAVLGHMDAHVLDKYCELNSRSPRYVVA
jgi:hypothetical protein